MKRETSTDYRHPYRPALIKVANRLGARVVPFRVSLDAEALIHSAKKKTKLDDTGDPSFREPLSILLRSIEEEAELHSIGRIITRARIVSMLVTRLRLEDLISRQPVIEQETLSRPIVIVGLPRTGTTFLHRLLASDTTRIRALMSWEALMPIATNGDARDERRIARAVRSEKALRYLAPDFFAVHPIDARGPEEEILLLDLAFRSTVPEATMNVPTYAHWLENADQLPAYRQMARTLKALQWQKKPTEPDFRWVLKTPHHLEWLEELPKVLDNPLIVWTHRAPADVVGSFCSMIAHGRGVFSDRVDPLEIGRAWLRKGKRMVERALDARARIGEANIIDVRYSDLIRDPLAVAKVVEERAGLAWNASTEARLKTSLGRETKDRHGVHRYHLSDFGLTEADVEGAFARYRSAIGV